MKCWVMRLEINNNLSVGFYPQEAPKPKLIASVRLESGSYVDIAFASLAPYVELYEAMRTQIPLTLDCTGDGIEFENYQPFPVRIDPENFSMGRALLAQNDHDEVNALLDSMNIRHGE